MKAKLIITAEFEYEINLSAYPSGMSLADMLALDVKAAEQDPYILLEGQDIKWDVKGEFVK